MWYFYSAWFLWSVITLIWTPFLHLSLAALYYQIEAFYLLFFIVYYFGNAAGLKQLALLININYPFVLGIGIIEILSGNHLRFSASNLHSYIDYRPTGMMVNTNDYAAVLVFFLIVFLMTDFKIIPLKTILDLTAFSITLYIIFHTNSRSALITFIVITFLYFITGLLGKQKGFFVLLLLLVIINILFFLTINYAQVSNMLERFLNKTNSTDERKRIYLYVLGLCRQTNYLGLGVGTTPHYVFYYVKNPLIASQTANKVMGVHNFLLAILSDTGILGLFPMLLFFETILLNSLSFIKKNFFAFFVSFSLLACFFGASIGSSSIFEMRIIWICLGCCIAVLSSNSEKEN
jgi:teichuronic acid biosynthesis protein TuaE